MRWCTLYGFISEKVHNIIRKRKMGRLENVSLFYENFFLLYSEKHFSVSYPRTIYPCRNFQRGLFISQLITYGNYVARGHIYSNFIRFPALRCDERRKIKILFSVYFLLLRNIIYVFLPSSFILWNFMFCGNFFKKLFIFNFEQGKFPELLMDQIWRLSRC